jgi:hypothetical protein
MAQRVTLRKRQPYNTKSSRRRVVKTPGGILRYHHIKKLPTAPKCGDCGIKLPGVRTRPPPRPVVFLTDARGGLLRYAGLCYIGRRAPPAPVRDDLKAKQDRQPRIRGLAVWRLRAFAVRRPPLFPCAAPDSPAPASSAPSSSRRPRSSSALSSSKRSAAAHERAPAPVRFSLALAHHPLARLHARTHLYI